MSIKHQLILVWADGLRHGAQPNQASRILRLGPWTECSARHAMKAPGSKTREQMQKSRASASMTAVAGAARINVSARGSERASADVSGSNASDRKRGPRLKYVRQQREGERFLMVAPKSNSYSAGLVHAAGKNELFHYVKLKGERCSSNTCECYSIKWSLGRKQTTRVVIHVRG